MRTNRRVCVINIENNMIMRTTREFAVHGVRSGQFRYTTKSALKKYMNRDVQLSKNERFIKAVEGKNIKRYLGWRIQKFKSLGGRLYYQIGGMTKAYSDHYGGGQILVAQY